MTSPSIELRNRQSLTLTPRLQQSVRLLQLSALELAQEVSNALATNPFLEYDEPGAEASDGAPDGINPLPTAGASATTALDETPTSSTADNGADDAGESNSASSDEPSGDFSADAYSSRAGSGAGDGDAAEAGEWMHAQQNLRELLHEELRTYPLGERDRVAAQIIIESLDDDGYLRQDFSDLVSLGGFEPALSEDEMRVALKLVQTLHAPGVGARSLAECLTLQLEAMDPATPGRDVAIELATHYLDKLARREQAELQKQLGCDAEMLRVACALIRRLNPKPGDSYRPQENNYVVPDVIVRQVKGKWTASINPAVMPRARIHRIYADLLAQSDGGSRSPLGQQLQEARWLMRNVQQRFATILRVAETIVTHQRAFFDYGEIALKPLVLRDVAQELGLHESTVSRATGNKYMATPRGIFEFKHFFPRELGTESGGTCSAAAVRALLKELISAESAAAPLSDVTLAKLLADQGVIVARRTVAKYRRLMKVPPAEMRKMG